MEAGQLLQQARQEVMQSGSIMCQREKAFNNNVSL